MHAPADEPPPLWKRLLPWILPPLVVLALLALLLLYFEVAPPVPFQYTPQ